MEGDCNNNTTINNESNKYEIRKNKGISDNTSINGRHSFCGGNEGRIEKVKNPLVENSKEKDESDRMKQLCKIALPHICLYVILCLYLLVGAWAFARIEHRAERLEQSKRLLQISNIYEQITSSIDEECSSTFIQNPESSQKQFNSKLLREGIYSSLSRLSQFFEGPQFRLSASEEPTTTGYASATPMTPFGQWLSIGYGLLGIPLTVLAAVDIGRFLSDVVLAIYDRILRTFRRLRKLCCRIRRRRTGPVTLQNIETNLLAFNTSQPSLANRRRHKQLVVNALPNKNKQKSKTNESEKNEETKRRLPLSVNAAILLLFCMLG
uniref:Potassium channel domain-containing protein n=1 Tax=Meloidogyne javanica TaxID=6303 RepID=A0A915NCZ3_MELJA